MVRCWEIRRRNESSQPMARRNGISMMRSHDEEKTGGGWWMMMKTTTTSSNAHTRINRGKERQSCCYYNLLLRTPTKSHHRERCSLVDKHSMWVGVEEIPDVISREDSRLNHHHELYSCVYIYASPYPFALMIIHYRTLGWYTETRRRRRERCQRRKKTVIF